MASRPAVRKSSAIKWRLLFDQLARMPNKDSAIGVFDSGIGGLTVLQRIIENLPKENTVYLGDTARAPYGTKSVETVLRYSFENTETQSRPI